ncbi:MAG: regulatory iron-sulfur-containing complex subunit RicT [Mucilaginibacter sp.]
MNAFNNKVIKEPGTGRDIILSASGYYGQSNVYDWLSAVASADMPQTDIVEVQFKGFRKQFYINDKQLPLANREMIIVGGDHGGYDIGQVSLAGPIVLLQLKKEKRPAGAIEKKVWRKASKEDLLMLEQVKKAERAALVTAKNEAAKLGLIMKFCDLDYQADRSLVTCYYTAPSRVDFRELVKILNKKLQTHVRMRQIGLLEESRRMGSIGPCGRAWCCHTWSTHTYGPGMTDLYERACIKYKDPGRGGKFACYIRE